MEILKRGEVPDEPKFNVTCDRCNSLLRCTYSELTNCGVYFAYICPVCKRPQHILPTELLKGKVTDG